MKKDLANGFAIGPFPSQELDTRLGHGKWRPLWRFAIQHGEKWRGIDDAHDSGHNGAQWSSVRVHH